MCNLLYNFSTNIVQMINTVGFFLISTFSVLGMGLNQKYVHGKASNLKLLRIWHSKTGYI